ncbi:unnamed protein product [Heterobilharzia americana]|nr:unnamed protein product [Heterobilharzia americana]
MEFNSEAYMNVSPAFILNKRANLLRINVSWTCEENGPYHSKVFCVKVTIIPHISHDSEVYFGIGKSITEAKHKAAESALRSCKLFQSNSKFSLESSRMESTCIKAKKSVEPFIILTECVSTSDTATAQLRRLLNLLGSKVKLNYSGHIENGSLPIMHNATAGIVGRQYVGSATTKSGAEQEACKAALEALRRSLLSYIKTQQMKRKGADNFDRCVDHFIHPKSPVWRLRILAGLHFTHPYFKIKKSTDCEPYGFTCTCVLDGWKSTESWSTSTKKAQDAAAQSMLNNLNQIESKCSTVQLFSEALDTTPKCSRTKNTKLCKTKVQFNHNRAFDESVHPVCRLECFRASKNLDKVRYILLNEQSEHGMHPSLAPCRPPFVYKIEFMDICIQGPEANNKRLAKRLAAELLLAKLKLCNQETPRVKSVLRASITSSPSTNHDKNDISENLLYDITALPEISDSEEKSISTTDKSNNLQHHTVVSEDQHVNFSCTSDILVFDDPMNCGSLGKRVSRPTKRKRFKPDVPCTKQYSRCHSSIHLSVNETKNLLQNYCPLSLSHSSSPNSMSDAEKKHDIDIFDKSIGFWTDPRKPKSNGRSYIRSNSESNLASNHWYCKSNCICDGTVPNVISDCTIAKSNIRLQILARVAAYCLKEHTSNSSLSVNTAAELPTGRFISLADQLVLLCRRLLVPCHFIDYPPNLDINYKKREGLDSRHCQYIVILLVGANPTNNTITLNYSEKNDDYISVKASDFTRNAAKQKAAQLVVQCLAKLIR